ncbi:alpha-amylase family glycosyl hydrolase [Lutimonas zeaxanthinifaciens]|uniref:alpha-amylase family glycosyl hydrolase n=1 Tax=Lutimonas zeaxanthinifaciens TaxID=3060215 RepID=UPI00265D2826|nr:alpha-amylase family glycosyl hydrolase [Lutimonas sp. YSD2104]WKK67567.1 alpha-amylase family glycosyl hydrolase [Lutimonas sp. YSD2104]
MLKNLMLVCLLITLTFSACKKETQGTAKSNTQDSNKEAVNEETPFLWENANLYFLLTDRFNNADPANDINFERNLPTAPMRGFQGGDIKGITAKIKDGYFTDLGINAIWFTPVVEQIHGGTDEGTGFTYGFHGYWAKDWTSLDPNFGTMEDLAELVKVAHENKIRIVMDAVINHTGPVTEKDPVWPSEWVRTSPKCEFNSYETAVTCTLVENLPDILTESNENVDLPEGLINKWKAEGRYEQEMAELDSFFERTGYPRAPRFYIIKWLSDFVRDFGIDGFRADTVRHIEEAVWAEFKKECDDAFLEWKNNNPESVLDNNDFYMVGEVYGYYIISTGKSFDFGDVKVNYYDHGFDSMINFEFKQSAEQHYEQIFSTYSDMLNNDKSGFQVLNYLTSHDDSTPFDKERAKPYETATKLLLSPGTAQVYYGDESARNLSIEGTQGDATLRSFMNWEEINSNPETQALLKHWQKLGKFRIAHPSVGAGSHKMISESPYVFQRQFNKGNFEDAVVVALDLEEGTHKIPVGNSFKEGAALRDAYSGNQTIVKNGAVEIHSTHSIILLEEVR